MTDQYYIQGKIKATNDDGWHKYVPLHFTISLSPDANPEFLQEVVEMLSFIYVEKALNAGVSIMEDDV